MERKKMKSIRKLLILLFAIVICKGMILAPSVSANQESEVDVAIDSVVGHTNRIEAVVGENEVSEWESSNPEVARVLGEHIIAITVGTATLSGKTDSKSYSITVQVFPDYVLYGSSIGLNSNAVTLYVGEQFQLQAGGVSNEAYSSEDDSVAEVSKDGLITAKKIGKTFINVKDTSERTIGYTAKCAVNVVENSGAFTQTLDRNDYTTYEKPFLEEYDKFYLLIDEGVSINIDGFESIVLEIMDEIEKTTGFFFYPKNGIDSNLSKKILIHFPTPSDSGYMDPTASDGEKVTFPNGQYYYGNANFYAVLIHELLHIVQMRNTIALTNILTEGFAESYTQEILDKLIPGNGYNEEKKEADELINIYGSLDQEKLIDCLLHPIDPHSISYFFVRFLRDEYGEAEFQRCFQVLNEKAGDQCCASMQIFTENEVYETIQNTLGEDLESRFYTWYCDVIKDYDGFLADDFDGFDTYEAYYVNPHIETLFPSGRYVNYSDSLLIDYSKLIEQTQKLMGKKYRGMALWAPIGDGEILFYDKDDLMIDRVSLSDPGNDRLFINNAVKIRLTGGSHVLLYVELNKMFMADDKSGYCGAFSSKESVQWHLQKNEDGETYTLLIEGTGDMDTYTRCGAPWYQYRKNITKVIIGDGVTSIAEEGFAECSIKEVEIADSVEEIGATAFRDCSDIKTVVLPESVKKIGYNAFVRLEDFTIIFHGDPPVVNDIFSTNLVTAYYPIENKSWTEEQKNNVAHGMNIQWKAMCLGNVMTHTFGEWETGENIRKRVCELCGYEEKEALFVVNYDLDGGTVEGNPTSYTETELPLTLKNPTKAGYAFTGWTGSNGIVPQMTVTIISGTTGEQTYKANWQKKKIELDKEEIQLCPGKETAISATVTPEDAENKTIEWTVSDPTIAEVSQDGVVTGLKEGTVTVTARATDESGVTASSQIVVGHTVVTDAAVSATCTETGLTEGSHCSVCKEVIKAQEVVPATGHTIVTDAAVSATCTETGLTEGSHCSVCEEVIKAQEVVPATGHTEVTDEAVAPTCTEDGLTEGSHCSVCKEVIKSQEVVPATGHTEVVILQIK